MRTTREWKAAQPITRPDTTAAQFCDEQPILLGKHHLVPLLKLGHHGLWQRRFQLEPVCFHAEGLKGRGHGTHRHEFVGDPSHPSMIGINHPLTLLNSTRQSRADCGRSGCTGGDVKALSLDSARAGDMGTDSDHGHRAASQAMAG